MLNCAEPLAVDAMSGVDCVAARRRDQRLRQFPRQEQLSVKMHVAAARHHSAQRGARVDAATNTTTNIAAATQTMNCVLTSMRHPHLSSHTSRASWQRLYLSSRLCRFLRCRRSQKRLRLRNFCFGSRHPNFREFRNRSCLPKRRLWKWWR